MGDTLRVKKPRANGTTSQMKRSPTKQRNTPPSSEQPRLLDQRNQQARNDNSMRLEIGNYLNLPMAQGTSGPVLGPIFNQSRSNSQAFLFNPGRQDSMLTLLSSYPLPNTQQPQGANQKKSLGDSAFPSYYMGPRDSVSGVSGMPLGLIGEGVPPGRIRGDLIFLPPPVSSKLLDEGLGQPGLGQNSSQYQTHQVPSQLRSNSIFSSLIQIPGLGLNSISEPSKAPNAADSNVKNKVNEDYNPSYDSISKDSSGNVFGWNPASKPTSIAGKNSKLSFDLSNAFLENSGLMGSIAGISNDSINAFLSSILNNGSVDFNSMSDQQRRDSILKFINTQQMGSMSGGTEQQPRKSSSKATLREDIFDKQRESLSSQQSRGQRKSSLGISDPSRFSPLSSMSSKSSNRYNDEPHSPKTSPTQLKRTLNPSETLALPPNQRQIPSTAHPASIEKVGPNAGYYPPHPYQQYPIYPDAVGQYPEDQKMAGHPSQQPGHLQQSPQRQNMGNQQFQPQMPVYNQYPQDQNMHPPQGYGMPPQNAPAAYLPQMMKNPPPHFSPGDKNYSYGNVQPQRPQQALQPQQQQVGAPQGTTLLPAQQFARSEDGRPLLGATKVDQLMLVIQAREKGNTGAIKQGPDGSILALPNANHDKNAVIPLTVDLVGGIEKSNKDDLEGGGDKKRRKGKTQQCPYCFKTFNQSTHLEVHVRSHIGYKPFQCSYCLKRFTQGGNLRTHMRLHTGEKPFTCEVCNRSFSRKGNLAAHMLTHNKEKPFECKLDNCDKSFTQLGNLKSHQNKFHLPTLNRLTQTLAELSDDALDRLPEEEKQLLSYFRKLYKNLNKGIRGRGRGGKPLLEGEDAISAGSSVQLSPQQLTIPRADN